MQLWCLTRIRIRRAPLPGPVSPPVRDLALVLPALLFLLLACFAPLVDFLAESLFSPLPSLAPFQRLIASTAYLHVVAYTIGMSALVGGCCVVLGYPLAYQLATAGPRWRTLLLLGVALPFLTSVLVRSYAWMVILGQHGLLNQLLLQTGLVSAPLWLLYRPGGVLIGMVHVLLPYAVLPLASVLRSLSRRQAWAAASLGAGPLRTFLFVLLPQSWPGMVAGFLLVFVLSLGFFVTPALLGGERDLFIAQLIQAQVRTFLNWPFAAVLALLLLLTTVGALALITRAVPLSALFGFADTQLQTPTGGPTWRVRRVGPWIAHLLGPLDRLPFERPVLAPAAALTLAFLVAPTLVVVPLSLTAAPYLSFPPAGYSLRWYSTLLGVPAWGHAVVASLQVATLSTLISLALGVPAAYGLVRGALPARRLIYGLLLLPLVLPTIVLGIGMYRLALPLGLVGAPPALALAHSVLSLPVVVLVMVAALSGIDPLLERAAASLGAPPLRSFWLITLPLIRPGVLSAAALAFLISFDELVLTLFLGGAPLVTLPLKLWEGAREELSPALAAAATLMLSATCVGLGLAGLAQRRRGAADER